MANKKFPFQYTIDKEAAAGTNDIVDDQVKSGYLFCYQRVAVINTASAYTRLRLLVKGGARDFIVSEQAAPPADDLYWDDVPIYVSEGKTLTAELTGCTALDFLQMHVTGWYQKISGEG